MIGWIITTIVIIIDCFIIKSTIKAYKDMKEAKRKAEIWGARF